VNQLDRRLRKLRVSPGRELRLDDIARYQHRPHAPTARSANVSGLQAVLGGHEPDDGAMFTVVSEGADDRWRVEAHQAFG
jgi:hypothetical protein